MAEVFAQFPGRIVSGEAVYRAQACGAPMNDGLWAGWIEFIPLDGGGPPLRSPRETTQPNRGDAEYWATGLTPVYLEGALRRAQRPVIRQRVEAAEPLFDSPAPPIVDVDARPQPTPTAVLDPVSVYQKGEGLLRQELRALSAWHLVNIVLAYRLSPEPAGALNRLPASALIERIVVGVRERSL